MTEFPANARIFKMKIKLIFSLILIGFLLSAFASPPPEEKVYEESLIIEEFEDENYNKEPEWWVFDNLILTIVKHPAKDKYSLSVKGKAENWYIGGIGTYLAKGDQDLSQYSYLELEIYGYGTSSGKISIEFYDDDNLNWQIENDPEKGFEPLYDDKFIYEIKVDWSGWKKVLIPIIEFKDQNPEIGDNVWNPQQTKGSGGLTQMQLIILADSKKGEANFIIDNIKFCK